MFLASALKRGVTLLENSQIHGLDFRCSAHGSGGGGGGGGGVTASH
jgi:hypothetical protein